MDLVTAEYHLAGQEDVQAQEILNVLLRKLRDSGARYFLPDALLLQYISLNRQGKGDEARASLEEARETAEAFNDRILLWQILAELGEKEAAEQVVAFIAGNISDSELHQTFQDYATHKIEQRSTRNL